MRQEVARHESFVESGSLFGRLELAQKRRLLDAFQAFRDTKGSVLDIGMAADSSAVMPVLTELDHTLAGAVTIHRTDTADGARSRNKVTGSFMLPYRNGEFDWACSSSVIEHLGNAERQFGLVREMARVAKKGIFLATPNRLHPLNFAGVPRAQMLRAQDLYRFAGLLPGKPAYDVGHKRLLGIKAHFFLMVLKGSAEG